MKHTVGNCSFQIQTCFCDLLLFFVCSQCQSMVFVGRALFSEASSFYVRVDCCFFAPRCLLAFCVPHCNSRPYRRRLGMHHHVSETDRHTNRNTAGQIDRLTPGQKAGHGGVMESLIFLGCCLEHVFISLCTHVEPCVRTRKCKYIPQADLGVSWRRVAERLCREFESIAGCACMTHTIIPFIGIVNFTDTFALLDQSLC